jgi:hypothetical protein
MASGRVLFVICWNVNGLASVASSSAHRTYEFLAEHDIVMLCETKLGSVPRHLLPKHTVHTLLASRDNVSGQGLLLGVKSSLGLTVRPWNPAGSRSGTIWLRVCQNAESQHNFFSSCYVPPVGSRQLLGSSVERRLQALGDQIRSVANTGHWEGTSMLEFDVNLRKKAALHCFAFARLSMWCSTLRVRY